MNGLNGNYFHSTNSVSQMLNRGFQTVSNWLGYSINFLQDLHLQESNVVVATLTAANVASFAVTHLFANWLSKRFGKRAEEAEENEELFKKFVTDVVVVGGMTYGFNAALSKVTQCPLNKVALVAITAGSIALHILLNRYFPEKLTEYEIESENEPVNEENPPAQPAQVGQQVQGPQAPALQPEGEKPEGKKKVIEVKEKETKHHAPSKKAKD